MGSRRSNHRPLRGGIGIIRSSGSGHYGTLTAVARRKIGDEKVLVTNRHVVSHGGTSPYDIQGSESVYQWEVNDTDKVGTLYVQNNKNSWLPVSPTNNDSIDLAALLVEDGVLTDFGVHEHGTSNAVHRKRPIVQPVKEPEGGLDLTFIGANSGKGEVSVSVPSTIFRYPIVKDGVSTRYTFNNVTHLDRRNHRAENGDSGAPVLWEDTDGNYHLCCINFSAGIDSRGSVDRDWGYAIPAKYAEDVLGVRFGIKAPTAVANAPAKAIPGQWVALDGEGSRSNEPGGDPLTYQWEWISGAIAVPTPIGSPAPPVTFPEQSTPTRNIAAPLHMATYTYKLTVTDNNGAKASDTVQVTVQSIVANAGANQTVLQGSTVTLDGSDSGVSVGDTLTHSWEQLGVPDTPGIPGVTLSSTSVAKPTFTAPSRAGALSFKLTVTDGNGGSDTDTVEVTVRTNNPPVAYAGPVQVITNGLRVTLDGSGSDPDVEDRDNLTYHWTQTEGTRVNLSSASVAKPTFQPPAEIANLVFRLTVTDPLGLSHTNDVTIKVRPSASPTPTPTPNPRPPGNAAPPLPQEAPPTPTSSQWDVRYSNNKIQVKVTSLPTVNPPISEVRAYLEAGQPPNLTTVTEAIGTSLNSWVTVLSSSDTQWQTGNWAAHIRFENSIGNSSYSDGKSATVPTPVSPPRPRPTPETWGPWTDTGVREEDDTDVPRIIWKEQRRTSNLGNTETRWVRA